MVDDDIRVITALDDDDARSFEIKVAGPAALLVSKVVKIMERRDQPHRLKPKDGLDVLRLLRSVDTAQLARRMRFLASNDLTCAIVEQVVTDLRVLSAKSEDLLPVLAADAEMGFTDPDEIKFSMVALVGDLLRELDA